VFEAPKPNNREGGAMSHTLRIDYGDDLLAALGLSPDEFAREAKFLLAAKLFQCGRLSSGQAARLCGRGRVDFLLALPAAGVSASNLRPDDAEAEIEFARHG